MNDTRAFPNRPVARRQALSRRARSALVAWAGVIATGTGLGLVLRAFGRDINLLPPILASFGPGPRPFILLPIAVAAALCTILPGAAGRLSWRWLLVVAPLAATAWAVSLALAEGASGLTRGVTWSSEYLANVADVRADPASFLQTFTHELGRYAVHVVGHPPGMVLLLAGLDRLGLGGPRWAATLLIGAGVTAPAAVLVAVRELADEAMARRCMPWLVVAPSAVWIATSADALYMALGAWAIAAVVLATGRRGWRSAGLALAGGTIGGLTLLGSYGLVLLAAVPGAAVWTRRSDPDARRAAVLASVAALAVLCAMVPFGFSWLEGLRATRREYYAQALDRPYWAMVVVNLAAWALALGPAVLVALAHLRDKRLWSLVGGGATAAALANLSGLSAGEVERIWLPFSIWVLAAGSAFVGAGRTARFGLSLQAATAITVVSLTTTHW